MAALIECGAAVLTFHHRLVCGSVSQICSSQALSTERNVGTALSSDSFFCYFCASFKVISRARGAFALASHWRLVHLTTHEQFVQCLVSSGVMPCRSRQRERRQKVQRCFTVALLHLSTY